LKKVLGPADDFRLPKSEEQKLILSADIPITSSDFWQNEDECTEEVLKHVFRSATDEHIPMFEERMAVLREAGLVLYEVSGKEEMA
jgi:Potential Queuosine, Q, salvage protein family